MLESLVREHLRPHNPGESIDRLAVSRFKIGKAPKVNTLTLEMYRPVTVFLTNGQQFEWSLEAMQSRLEASRVSAFTNWSIWIFAAGAALQVVGFLTEDRMRLIKGNVIFYI